MDKGQLIFRHFNAKMLNIICVLPNSHDILHYIHVVLLVLCVWFSDKIL